MTVKSIIDIELNADSFKAFHELFTQYNEQLAKMPKEWQDMAKGIKNAGTELDRSAKGVKDVAKDLTVASKAMQAMHGAATRVGLIWHNLARDTRTVAGNIADITRSLLRWGEITGVVSGLLGGGGLYGISRLAQSAASGRSTASGLDVSYGQNRAFSINYGRYLDNPGGTLGAVSNALHDATSPGYRALLGAGLSPQFLSTHNAAEVSAELMRRLPGRIPHSTAQDKALEGARLKAYGLDSIISQQEFNRYVNSSPEERRAQEQGFLRDSKDFDQSGKTQRDWQDLSTQLERAGTKIEEVFIKGLAPLAKPISDLSDSLSKAIASLLGSDKLKEWITGLGAGIEKVSQYLLSDSFEKSMREFAQGVVDIANVIASAVKWIRGLIGGGSGSSDANSPATGAMSNRLRLGHNPSGIDLHSPYRRRGGRSHPNAGPMPADPLEGSSHSQGDAPAFNPLEGSSHWDGYTPMAYHPGASSGRVPAMERFKQSFTLLILGADALTARFKDMADVVGQLTDGGGGTSASFDGSSDGSGSGVGGGGGARRGGGLRGMARGRTGGGSVPDLGTYDGPAATGKGMSNAQEFMSFLINKKGYSQEGAAIVAGNVMQESSFNPTAWGDKGIDNSRWGVKEKGSWGLAQWNKERLAALQRFGGANWKNKDVQMEFLAREVEQKGLGWIKKQRDFSRERDFGHLYEGFAKGADGSRYKYGRQFNKGYKPSAGDVTPYQGSTKRPSIRIENNTGGNTNISASLLTIGTG